MKNILKGLLSTSVALAFAIPLVSQAQDTESKNDVYESLQIKHEVVQDGSVVFPDPSKSYLDQAPIYNKIDFKLLTYGLNKDDVRRILGSPHFNEFSPSNWNYLVGVKSKNTNQVNTCQLQIHFGDDGLANKIYWNNGDCIKSNHQRKIKKYKADVVEVVSQAEPTTKKTIVEIERLDDGDNKEIVSENEITLDY